jgi:sulfite reductase (NADPH) hemoprotein beta-component
MADESAPLRAPQLPPSAVEDIKTRSRHLRGTLVKSLSDPLTAALRPDDTQLSKFHGFYQQDDRDLRAERQAQKLEPLYSFMVRICVPGGVLAPRQWLALDELAARYGDGGLRITTRQAVQLHGVIKSSLKATILAINEAVLTTLAACGDVNRNVMGTPLTNSEKLSDSVQRVVRELSVELAPRTRAYHEIWLDGGRLPASKPPGDEEPLYGATYLPRKFKCAVVVPPDNDVDVYAQDLGLVAISEDDTLVGFNVLAGGGMGRSHGDDSTYARVGSMLGFCSADQCLDVARAVVAAQRDLGNRGERHHARLKYTMDRVGVGVFRAEVERRVGFAFQPARPFELDSTLDRFGWSERAGRTHLHLHVPSGRVRNAPGQQLRQALRELAEVHEGSIRLTGNQNLILADVVPSTRSRVQDICERYRLLAPRSGIRLSALSCVALPTCGLAMAEAERYLPSLLDLLEQRLDAAGLRDERIVLRMTGCPNGCARPYNAEIGLVGRAPGLYDLYLGGGIAGTRLAKLTATNVKEPAMVELLGALFDRFAREREPGERFGDFCARQPVLTPDPSG